MKLIYLRDHHRQIGGRPLSRNVRDDQITNYAQISVFSVSEPSKAQPFYKLCVLSLVYITWDIHISYISLLTQTLIVLTTKFMRRKCNTMLLKSFSCK